MEKNAPIGVFDSGVGGLTVVREIMDRMPSESIIYFGDTARVPYGSKSRPTILRYTRQILHFLGTKEVKAVVIACNTASAYALDTVEKELSIPILGVVKPGAAMAARATRNGNVGVIATDATIGSGIYNEYIRGLDPSLRVSGKACPLFVPLVEEGLWEDPVTEEMARRYLAELSRKDIDTLILGCTHYPLIRQVIGRVAGEGVTLVNPAYETAAELERMLDRLDLKNDSGAQGTYEFYVSDAAEKMKRFANSILPCDIEETRVINIEEY